MSQTCDGCGENVATKHYEVTNHSGAKSRVRYCDDCRDLAAVDWNGETAAIVSVPAEVSP